MVALDAVRRAHDALPAGVRDTPQYRDAALDRALGRPLTCKFECFNPIRSFKYRGAHTLIDAVPDGARLVCASAGNFGQGLAAAAAPRGLDVRVFAAETASPNKVERMRELGATVDLVGADYDAAKLAARAHADADPDAVWVEDGADPLITVGAATIGLELAPLGLDTLLVPVGNGALVVGVASWLAAHSPATRVIGVCAAGAPAMLHSWERGEPVTHPDIDTIAEGVGVRVPIPSAVAATRALVPDMLAVDDDTLRAALRLVRDATGILVEPAGAIGVAALLAHGPDRIPGKDVGTVVTGANFPPGLAATL